MGSNFRRYRELLLARQLKKLQPAMSSLQGLPPLPASLSAVLGVAGGRDEWRLLADSLLPPSAGDEPTYSNVPPPRAPPPLPATAAPGRSPPTAGYARGDARGGSPGSAGRRAGPLLPLPRTTRRSPLDHQLERLRREMSDLRQLDLALLYQLWSLNDAIQEFKQAVRSPSWDNGYDGSADEEEAPRRGLSVVSERLSASSSSSLEFGDV